jgi:hypothetical protein
MRKVYLAIGDGRSGFQRPVRNSNTYRHSTEMLPVRAILRSIAHTTISESRGYIGMSQDVK